MFGLIIIVAIAIYFLLSLGVVWYVRRYARIHGGNSFRWGLMAALAMFLIPFWDWLPTTVMHRHYCATESGLWIYKTPEQWSKENSEVLELEINSVDAIRQEREGDKHTYSYALNDRIRWVVSDEGSMFPNRWRHERQLVDSKQGEVLVRYIDFSTSQIAPKAGWSGWKIWLTNKHCPGGKQNQVALNELRAEYSGGSK